MKKYLLIMFIATLALPAVSAEFDIYSSQIPATESVKQFTRPLDSRFQYGFPDRKDLSIFKRHQAETSSEEEDVVLDESDVKPVKKVIKKITPNTTPQNPDLDKSSSPMNYDSFPKFFDANDMMNQQVMPMIPMTSY